MSSLPARRVRSRSRYSLALLTCSPQLVAPASMSKHPTPTPPSRLFSWTAIFNFSLLQFGRTRLSPARSSTPSTRRATRVLAPALASPGSASSPTPSSVPPHGVSTTTSPAPCPCPCSSPARACPPRTHSHQNLHAAQTSSQATCSRPSGPCAVPLPIQRPH